MKSQSDPVVRTKAKALAAMRADRMAAARRYVSHARALGATQEEIAFMLGIDTWGLDAVALRHQIAAALNGRAVEPSR